MLEGTKRITDVKELEVGDRILIQNKPQYWDSVLHRSFPLDLKFPHFLTIKKLRCVTHPNHPEYSYTAMTCGEYGWDLDAIIQAGCYLLERENDAIKANPLYTNDLIEIL